MTIETKLPEIEEDLYLLSETEKRLKNNRKTVSFKDVIQNLSIQKKELEDFEDITIG